MKTNSELIYEMTDSSVTREKNGITFDVAMNDSLGVEKCQRFKALFANGGDLFLIHTRVRHYVCESTPFEELHNNP